MAQLVEYVRKKDFKIGFALPMLDDESQEDYQRSLGELVEAVFVVKPSFVDARLTLMIGQPVLGDVTNSVIRMCKFGVEACRLRTVFPDRHDLIENEDCSHILYEYAIGQVVEQETPMVRRRIEGEDDGEAILVHTLVLRFEKFRVDTNVLDANKDAKRLPTLSLVPNTGSDLVVAS